MVIYNIYHNRQNLTSGESLVLTEHECMGPKLTQEEGYVLGVGGKMFQIAGPVIVYGVSASVIYGFIYWLWSMI